MAGLALVDVRDIVEWIRHTEGRMESLYARAAETCRDDPPFCAFLRRLSEDEKSHAGFMASASEQLRDIRNRLPLDILLDGQTRNEVDDLLERFGRLLARPAVEKRAVIEYAARAEASELNPIFLYVAEEYRKTGREGEWMTGEIQRHLLRIQDFIDDLPDDQKPSVNVGTLPFVGEDRFLVVEDRGPLRRLMASLLARRGAIDTASAGPEGLEKLHDHFHDGIVTDVQMPGMDGLEFYQRAVAYDSRLAGRFLFCAKDMTAANESYLRAHDLPLLQKPFGLEEFQAAIDGILSHNTEAR